MEAVEADVCEVAEVADDVPNELLPAVDAVVTSAVLLAVVPLPDVITGVLVDPSSLEVDIVRLLLTLLLDASGLVLAAIVTELDVADDVAGVVEVIVEDAVVTVVTVEVAEVPAVDVWIVLDELVDKTAVEVVVVPASVGDVDVLNGGYGVFGTKK